MEPQVCRSQVPLRGVDLKEIGQVLVMECFIGEEEQFAGNAELDQKPVEAFDVQ